MQTKVPCRFKTVLKGVLNELADIGVKIQCDRADIKKVYKQYLLDAEASYSY